MGTSWLSAAAGAGFFAAGWCSLFCTPSIKIRVAYMADSRQFRFTHDVNASAFSKELSHRVDRYFQERGISRHANAEMISKTILGFAMTIAAYAWLMTGRFTALDRKSVV